MTCTRRGWMVSVKTGSATIENKFRSCPFRREFVQILTAVRLTSIAPPSELYVSFAMKSLSLSDSFATFQPINSPGDEIANVNFVYDDIVHVLQNTTDSCINSATDRCGYVLERMFTNFSEICNGHYAVQGHSRSPILVPVDSSYTPY